MSTAQDQYLDTANRIGARLCRDALWADHRCNWLGSLADESTGRTTPAYRASGPDLYAGTAGIALFLGSLYRLSDVAQYRITALGAMRQALSRYDDLYSRYPFGLYNGIGSIAYAMVYLGEIFEQKEMIQKGIDMLARPSQALPSSYQYDLLSGSAGFIQLLLLVHNRYPSNELLNQARYHGDRLLEGARKHENGWSWPTSAPAEQPFPDLAGYSHGSSGIAMALLALWRATNDDRFREGAVGGFGYERHWRDQERTGLYPDGTLPAGASHGTPADFGMTWCHGPPGIAISLIQAYRLTGEQPYRDEAEALLGTVVASLQAFDPATTNFSLCHGVAGNADMLLTASSLLGETSYRRTAEQIGQKGIALYESKRLPWPSGALERAYSPTLMLGEAGIGYFYLRLADPERTPSVLCITSSNHNNK